MKKVFRLANAEFNKIFYRPSIFILTALLIITIVLTNFFYKPVTKTTMLNYESNNVNGIYSQFLSSNKKEINKSTIDSSFLKSYQDINQQYESITTEDKLEILTTKTLLIKKYFPHKEGINDVNGLIIDERTNLSTSTPTDFPTQKNKMIEVFNSLKNDLSNLMNYLAEIQHQTLNFYFLKTDYDEMYDNLEQIYNAIPKSYTDYNKEILLDLATTIATKYSIDKSVDIVASLKDFTIKSEDYDNLIKTYYQDAKTKLNDVYFKQIEDFANAHKESNTEKDMAQLNKYIANYYSFTQMNKTVMENKFMLLRINNVDDTVLPLLIGYQEVYKYKLSEEIELNTYMIKNETFDYNYLSSFNFNKASGYQTNAYDYTVYSMQILNILIIVFTIFYACSSIAGDQNSGTMKMIAVRPFSRNKLFTGKYLSCVIFGVMLMLISGIASFVVGAISFGVPMNSCLVVFNSSVVLTINPILMLLIYFISSILNLLFYISLAMFICLIFKSNTLSVFIASMLYGTQIIMSGLVNNAWLNYTPFGHFDLFKFFGNSQSGFLGFNILPNANFLTSAVVLGLMIVIFNVVSHLIFKRRDIA